MTQQLIQITEIENEPRIDSRIVAEGLGIQHRNFLETVRKYQTELEQLGILPFETEVLSGPGQPPVYIMLNEDQVTFATQLSRNTPQVIQFKLALTKAFSEARNQIIPSLKEQIALTQATLIQALQVPHLENSLDYTQLEDIETLIEKIQKEHGNVEKLMSLCRKVGNLLTLNLNQLEKTDGQFIQQASTLRELAPALPQKLLN